MALSALKGSAWFICPWNAPSIRLLGETGRDRWPMIQTKAVSDNGDPPRSASLTSVSRQSAPAD